eukprot:COSAG06_NODE_62148_length_265_cov_11.451807_1_plen_43_part_10
MKVAKNRGAFLHYLLLLIDGQPAGAVPWSAAPAARQQSSTKRR